MDRPETEVVDYDDLIAGGGMAGCATNTRRPRAVGEDGVFRDRHAIGSCVDFNWLSLG
jgi:hypothetical protein